MKYIVGFAIMTIFFSGPVAVSPPLEQETCPGGGGWTKYEPIGSVCYDITIPEGKTATHICYKSSTTVIQGAIDPPVIGPATFTVCSTVQNQNGETQELSHISVLYGESDPTETPTNTATFTPSVTPSATPKETHTPTPEDPNETPVPSETLVPSDTPTPCYQCGKG